MNQNFTLSFFVFLTFSNVPIQTFFGPSKKDIATELLIKSIQKKDEKGTAQAIKDGAETNYDRKSEKLMLIDAIHTRSPTIVQHLLNAKADPNIVNFFKWSSLHFATNYGDSAIVHELLTAKANPNVKNDQGDTPLHLAIRQNKLDIANQLLKYGADVNAQNDYKTTPLHEAFNHKNFEAARLLINHKARTDIKDRTGRIPGSNLKKEEYDEFMHSVRSNPVDIAMTRLEPRPIDAV